MLDKSLKGQTAQRFPQEVDDFEFVINLNAAKQIGLAIPHPCFEQAHQ
jgi:ABC-type uncharacterized transport system substrate-binding protein